MLRVLFAGSTPQAKTVLQHLLERQGTGYRICGVYTRPDRASGRRLRIHKAPTATLAEEHRLPVEKPDTWTPEAQQRLANFSADLFIVVAYGALLPRAILDTPKLGCVNIHYSLLPRWRGAAPVERAILSGDRQTGICLMRMAEALDKGDIIAAHPLTIQKTATTGELKEQLTDIACELLDQFLAEPGTALQKAQTQASEGATYAAKVRKAETLIDWKNSSAEQIVRQINAFNPRPMAHTFIASKKTHTTDETAATCLHLHCPETVSPGDTRINILHASVAEKNTYPHTVPGRMSRDHKKLLASCQTGTVEIHELQPQGRKAMKAIDFINGHLPS